MAPNSYQLSSHFHLTLLTLYVLGAVFLTLKYDPRASLEQYHRNNKVEQSSSVHELNYGSDQAQERKPVIHTFYPSAFNLDNMTRRYLEETLDRKSILLTWKKAWSEAGWETVVLTLADAQNHPYFDEFNSLLRLKGISYNYQSKYLRFLAISSAGGGWFSDLSVLPLYPIQNKKEFSSLPNNGEFTSQNGYNPSMFSGKKEAWDNILHKFMEEMKESELSTMKKNASSYHNSLNVLNSGDKFSFDMFSQPCERIKKIRAINFLNVDIKKTTHDGIDYFTSMYLWIKIWRNKCLNNHFTTDSETNRDVMEKYNQSKSQQNVPDFLIIGAQKAATTFMNYLLQHHPMIGIHKIKEKHYFDKNELLTREGYMKKFPEADGRHLTFDATPETMFWTKVLPQIQEICPWVKIIVMLRNPIDRLFSQYNMYTEKGWFKGSFKEFIADDLKLLEEVGLLSNEERQVDRADNRAWKNLIIKRPHLNSLTVARGLYSLQLSEWFKYFAKDSFLVLNYHDLEKENGAQHMYDKVLSFLDLPPHNIGSIASDNINRGHYEDTQSISDKTKSILNRLYHPYNQQLRTLLGDDWKGFGDTSSEIHMN